jgi:putative transferase (TIGR04331 family)
LVARTLITTAIEETWPKDKNEPVLFLGEWCKLYNRKSIWEGMNANTESYHWDDREKLYADYIYLKELYEELIVELVIKLNEIHAVNHSARYWKILIGPWLGYFIQVLFDRWFMLKQVVEKTDITVCKIIKRDLTDLIPNDMEHFNSIYNEDDWNEAIYGQLLEECWSESILVEKVQLRKMGVIQSAETRQGRKVLLKSIIKRWVFSFINALPPNENKYFFISTYLPGKIDASLQMRLGQFPRLWKNPPVSIVAPIQREREWELGECKARLNSFDKVARQMIPLHIPTAYLEGYKVLTERVERLPWPSRPKAIFTSNAYSADDLFKAWAAKNTELEVPLIIGQHGGNFGMSLFSFHEDQQIEVADKWLSWGWSDPSRPKILPVGNFKDSGSIVEYNPKGGALMVEMALPRYSYHMYAVPVSRQWLDYYNDQILFVKKLPRDIQKELTVRLYSKDYGWNQKERWGDDLPNVKLDNGIKNIKTLIGNSRLYISTYNATTYLETLNRNIPTIIFWNCNHWELKEDVKSCFDLLESVGIFHKTPESAAIQVEKIWNNIEQWWHDEKTQAAVNDFCHLFTRQLDNSVNEMKKALL